MRKALCALLPLLAPLAIAAATLRHPTLGALDYIHGDQVSQFYLPFANAARFRQSKLINHFPGTYNATAPGPQCPQYFLPVEAYTGELPSPFPVTYGEDCLNLAVTVPTAALNSKKPLPIMVYLHGGSNAYGTSYNEGKTDARKIVELSIKQNEPVIVVAVDYRLNYFGFLASSDLVAYNKKHNEPPSNYAMYDIRNAFLWVQKNIRGFGGDPDQVTAMGQSAGSIMISLQMSSNVPDLFNRAIMQSGVQNSLVPFTLEQHEPIYEALFSLLGLPYNVSAEERVQSLINVPYQNIIDVLTNATPGGPVPDFFHSFQDPSFYPQVITAANEGEILANCEWVDEMIIGHTFFEGDIFIGGLQPPTFNYTVLVEIMEISYGANRTQAVLDYYKITPDLSSYLLEFAAGYLFGDILLSQDINNIVKQIAIASNDTKPVYYYNFGQQNPIEDSPLFGYAHHEIDLLYLFQDYNPYFYYDYDRYAAVEFGKAWLAFVNGRAPWTPFTIGGGEVAATLRDRVQEFKRAHDHYGRYRFWEFLNKLGIDDTVGQFFT